MKKLAIFAALVALVVPSLFAPSAFAESPGQLAGGTNIYQVRNVTTNTEYSQTASVKCGETVKYSIKLSNTEYGLLSNINAKASLTSGTATVSATNSENETVTTSGKVTVTLEKGSLNYIAGSTQVVDADGKATVVSDGITSTSVNVGTLNGSTHKYVQFQAKLSCPTAPPVTPPVTPPTTPETPTELPQTGTTENVAAVLGLGAIVAATSYFVASRRALNRN